MLVLSRKSQQAIQIGDNVTVTIVEIGQNRVRLAIDAPPDTAIWRAELLRQPVELVLETAGDAAVRAASNPAANAVAT